MNQLEKEFRKTIREEVAAFLGDGNASEPELITIKQAAEFCGHVGEDTIRDLFKESATNGFPAVVLGRRTHLVDKTRLVRWLALGGLNADIEQQSANVVPMRKAG